MANDKNDKITAATENKTYDTSSIMHLEDLEHIRLRPGMYVTNSGKQGLHHLIWELMDNSVDEIANKHGDTIQLIIYEDGSLSVEDNGRGVPAEYSEKHKMSGLQLIYCTAKAGGKFNNDNYKFSGGLHGVGASVVTALSEWIEITSKRNGLIYYQKFRNFTGSDGVCHVGVPVSDVQILGKTNETGTLVHFKPDRTVLETVDWDFEAICRRMQETAFLVNNITIKLEDRRCLVDPDKYGE